MQALHKAPHWIYNSIYFSDPICIKSWATVELTLSPQFIQFIMKVLHSPNTAVSTNDISPWHYLQHKIITYIIWLVKSIIWYPALFSDSFSQVGILEVCIQLSVLTLVSSFPTDAFLAVITQPVHTYSQYTGVLRTVFLRAFNMCLLCLEQINKP